MFEGTGTALITPFDENYDIDYSALENLVNKQLDNNIDSLIILGTTGEAPTIHRDEKKKLIKTVVNIVNGDIPVIIGTGTNDTSHVIQNSNDAKEWGADGQLVVTPYYNKGTQDTLYKHYSYIAEETDLPIILYNVPSRTGVNLEAETTVKLAEDNESIIAVKEASGDISQVAKIIANKPADFKVYSGNDDQAFPLIALGGHGLVSVASNVVPGKFVELTHNLLDNNMDAAREINNKYNVLMNSLFLETNPIPVKYAVSQQGLCKNILRLPLSEMSEENSEKLKSVMQELEII